MTRADGHRANSQPASSDEERQQRGEAMPTPTHGLSSPPSSDRSILTTGSVTVLNRAGAQRDLAFATTNDREYVDFVFLHAGRLARREEGAWVDVEAELLVISGERDIRLRMHSEWQLTAVRVPLKAIETFLPRPLEPFSAIP